MTRRFSLKRYVKVLNGKIVDTTLLLPHTECYFIEEGAEGTQQKLFVEQIDGSVLYLGKVVVESNELSSLITRL